MNGKIVVITGSSRGSGATTAELFARRGARVVVHGRDETAFKKLHGAITNAGGQAMWVAADLTRFNEIERMRQRSEREYGVVDVLVANAGGSHAPPGPFEQLPEEGRHGSSEGNLTATFFTIKSFLPSMKSKGVGSIITISSSVGRRANGRSPIPYAAAKAGIQIFTKTLK